MPSSTTILFVPGAWHEASVFNDVGEILQRSGYRTCFVDLPSVGANPPLEDFSDDVAKIRHAVQTEAEKGQRVVLVAHSYGGVPASEAVKGLDVASREKNGLRGGVSHMFFCCSFLIPEGTSLFDASGGSDLPWVDVDATQSIITTKSPRGTFYNDMSDDEAQKWMSKLQPHSYKSFFSPITNAAWRTIPSTYLYCLKDEAIPISYQKEMVEDVAKGIGIHTQTIDAGHSPFLSKPVETANAIMEAAGL